MKKIKLIGNIITIIAIIFLIYKLFNQDLDIEVLFSQETAYVLIPTVLIYVISVLLSCFSWMKLLSILNAQKLNWKKVNTIYAKSNLLKYIPGNVFQYIGRNQLAIDYQISHMDVILASALEIICLILAAALFSLVMSGRFVLVAVRQFALGIIPTFLIILLLFAATIFLVRILFRQKFLQYISPRLDLLKKCGTWRKILCAIGIYLLIYTLQSSAFLAILCVYSPVTMPFLQIPNVMGAYALSWLLGYITPGSPGGLGIRELVLFSLLSQFAISEETVTLSLIIARTCNILGDILVYLIAYAIERGYEKQGENI